MGFGDERSREIAKYKGALGLARRQSRRAQALKRSQR
jgi:hypothetical protein